jgi:1-acyl-sn-glycerol-3-phosphate acyltransferase
MSHVFADDEATVAAPAGRGDAFYWRFIGTAVGFSMFGVGAIFLSLIVLPIFRLLPQARCQRLARGSIRAGTRFFFAVMRGLRIVSYDFHGRERLGQPGQLIVANHPSLIDAMFLIAATPQVVCVAKYAMFRNPLTRNVVAAAGYVSNEQPADMIGRAAATLASGQCLLMFPEATRSVAGKPLVFQRGAANIAMRAAARVTPVYIRCQPITLTKGEPWYRIPPRRPHFTLIVGEDFDLAEPRAMSSIPLAARAFNEHMRLHFQGELSRLGGYTAAGTGDGTTTDKDSQRAG